MGTYLRCLTAGPAKGRSLICFPHAGGGPSCFHRWSRHCRPGTAVYAAQLPGRELRLHEPFATDLKEVAARVAAEAAELAGSVALFGHSMGALVAFEAARQLRAMAKEPRILVVSAASAPHAASRNLATKELDDHEFLHLLSDRYGALPKEILNDPDSLAFYLSVLRSDMALLEDYRFEGGAMLECELCVAYGSEDYGLDASRLTRWQELSRGAFSLSRFSGDHFYHFAHAAELVRRIERALEQGLTSTYTGKELSDA